VLLNKEADRTLVHSAVQCVIGQFNMSVSQWDLLFYIIMSSGIIWKSIRITISSSLLWRTESS